MPRLTTTFILLLAITANADVLVLKDGTRLEGDVSRDNGVWTVTAADGTSKTVSPENVKSFQLGGGAAGTKTAAQEAQNLASLRRASEALPEIDQIIERYNRLIAATKDPKVIEDAKSDLQGWQGRRDQGMVKHGSRWVLPTEIDAVVNKATTIAEEARELMRQNRTRDADQLLQKAIEIDPSNAAAQYLRGVSLYRQSKLSDARKAFEASDSKQPNHAPTLNNLAVILWRQNQQAAALNYYDLAMAAAGPNQYILDNVADALGTLPDAQKKSPLLAKAMRRFTELDLILQQQMQQKGMYRWGGSWVDQKKLDELKTAEKESAEKINALQSEFDQTNARIKQIDAIVRDNETNMADIRTRSVAIDNAGKTYAFPLPQQYYDLRAENQMLRSEQDALITKRKSMQEQAQRTQKEAPRPAFTGVQQIVGVEGMPDTSGAAAAPSDAPTPAPSSAPADL